MDENTNQVVDPTATPVADPIAVPVMPVAPVTTDTTTTTETPAPIVGAETVTEIPETSTEQVTTIDLPVETPAETTPAPTL